MTKSNKIIAWLIIIVNIYFIPVSILIIIWNGGPAGASYWVLPFSILINLFFVPAVLSFKKDYENRVSKINRIGIIIILLMLILGTLVINFA